MARPRILLDHVTTYAEVEELGAHLDRYRKAGFVVDETIVAHANGVRSGVLRFGSEYVEILEVADVDTFERDAPINDRVVAAAFRPFGLGFKTPELGALRDAWIADHELPDITTLHARDEQTAANLTFRILQIPLKLLRGASCFVVEKPDDAEPRTAPNGTYALAAITLVAAEARDRARQWSALLTGDSPLGHHEVYWSTPAEYAARFGRVWQPVKHPLGELAVIHLLCEDLSRAQAYAIEAGRACHAIASAAIVVEPDPCDGLVFAIHASPRDHWEACRARGQPVALW